MLKPNKRLITKVTRDEDIRDSVYQLLTMNPFAIQAIKGSYVDDDMWKYAIDLEPIVFQYIDTYKKIPSTKLCMYALKADGRNIQYIHPSRITERMIEVAEKTYPDAKYVVRELKSDSKESNNEPFQIIKEKYTYVQNMEDKMNTTILSELRSNPSMIKEIENPTDEMKAVALIANPDIVLYFDELSATMVEILEEYYPDVAPMYPNYIRFKEQHSSY